MNNDVHLSVGTKVFNTKSKIFGVVTAEDPMARCTKEEICVSYDDHKTGYGEPREIIEYEGTPEYQRAVAAMVAQSPAPAWREENGVIRFSVTSDGTTGSQWIERLRGAGFRVNKHVQYALTSKDFIPTSGVTYEVGVLKGTIFDAYERDTPNIRAEAQKRGLTTPNMEVACLIRGNFRDEDIKVMGLGWIAIMHEPIKDPVRDPMLLAVNRRLYDGRWLDAFHERGSGPWAHSDGGFAFVRPHLVDCDADPFVPKDLLVEEHRRGGRIDLAATKMTLFFPRGQKKDVVSEDDLRKEMANQPVLNANVLDYLLANPDLIPHEWEKEDRAVFFWGTIYRNQSGYRYVRYLHRNAGRWDCCYAWANGGWISSYPAAIIGK